MRTGRPLVLPSAVTPVGVAAQGEGDGPRRDFAEIARVLAGRVLFPEPLPGVLGALERTTRRMGYWHQAWQAVGTDPPVVVSLAEKIGMCVSLLDARCPHVVVAHNLTTPRRQAFQLATRWLARPDRIVVLSRPQEAYLRKELGLPASRVRFVHNHVDHKFFFPQGGGDEGYVLSVGQTGRDYRTLIDATAAIAVPTVIVPSSRWIKAGSGRQDDLPPNVTLRHDLSDQDLRTLYDRASVVVVPLQPGLTWAAGVSGVLEAMAMKKPLVVSSTPGLEGYVVDGEDSLCVPPAEPLALRTAITNLLGDRATADRLAATGRARVEAGRNLDEYVSIVAGVASDLLG